MREVASGIGFVDVLVTFSWGLVHVIELKMLKGKGYFLDPHSWGTI